MSGVVKALVTVAAVAMSAAAEEEVELAHVHMYEVFDTDGVPGLSGEELEEMAVHLGINDVEGCAFEMGDNEAVLQGDASKVVAEDVVHGVLMALAVLKTEGVCTYMGDSSVLLGEALGKGVNAWGGAATGTLGREELMALYGRLHKDTIPDTVGDDAHAHAWQCLGASGVLDKHNIDADTRLSPSSSTVLVEVIEEFLVEAAEACPLA